MLNDLTNRPTVCWHTY